MAKAKKLKHIEVLDYGIKIKNSNTVLAEHIILENEIEKIIMNELESQGFNEKKIMEVIEELKILSNEK